MRLGPGRDRSAPASGGGGSADDSTDTTDDMDEPQGGRARTPPSERADGTGADYSEDGSSDSSGDDGGGVIDEAKDAAGEVRDTAGDVKEAASSAVDTATETGEELAGGGTAGKVAAAGVGIAAIPEPTPITETTGAVIAGTAIGGAVAYDAARRAEIGLPDLGVGGNTQQGEVPPSDPVVEEEVPARESPTGEVTVPPTAPDIRGDEIQPAQGSQSEIAVPTEETPTGAQAAGQQLIGEQTGQQQERTTITEEDLVDPEEIERERQRAFREQWQRYQEDLRDDSDIQQGGGFREMPSDNALQPLSEQVGTGAAVATGEGASTGVGTGTGSVSDPLPPTPVTEEEQGQTPGTAPVTDVPPITAPETVAETPAAVETPAPAFGAPTETGYAFETTTEQATPPATSPAPSQRQSLPRMQLPETDSASDGESDDASEFAGRRFVVDLPDPFGGGDLDLQQDLDSLDDDLDELDTLRL